MNSKVDVSIILVPPSSPDREQIQALYPAYLAELGVSAPRYPLELYWSETERFPYKILVADKIVGFALVWHSPVENRFHLAEFYVAPPFRRTHIGSNAFQALVRHHEGSWELTVLPNNLQGQRFWSSVLPASVQSLTSLIRPEDGCSVF